LLLKTFQNIKGVLGKTFVVDQSNKDSFVATKEEGFVLLSGKNMIKLVDRIEFTKNNAVQHNEEVDAEIETPEVPVKKKTFIDKVTEEILDQMEMATLTLDPELSSEDIVESIQKMKEYSAIFVGRFQPPTIAHLANIVNLSKQFGHVYVLLSEGKDQSAKYMTKNPLKASDRILAFKSDPALKSVRNVTFVGGSTSSIFGIHNPEEQDKTRKLLGIDPTEKMVVAIGKEDDRYYAMLKRGDLFDVNSGKTPSKKQPVGLFGIDLIKDGSIDSKVSASTIREYINKGKINLAKKMMVGSEDVKDATIEKLKSGMEKYTEAVKFELDLSIVKDIQKKKGISQEEAFDMILNFLK
jgi:hypothetical protein